MWFLDKLFPVAELWFSKLIVYIQTNTVYCTMTGVLKKAKTTCGFSIYKLCGSFL